MINTWFVLNKKKLFSLVAKIEDLNLDDHLKVEKKIVFNNWI